MMQSSTPLLVVSILLRSKPELSSLLHIGEKVSSFLDSSVELPLHQACKFGSLELMNRIWNSTVDLEHEREPFWSVRNLLRSDSHYQRFVFTFSLVEAAKQRKLDIVQWLFELFPDCDVDRQVVEQAAEAGALEVLEFFRQNGNNLTAYDDDEVVVNEEQRGIDWGYKDALKAALAGHQDVVKWLYESAPSYTRDDRKTTVAVIANGGVALIKWLWDRLDMPPYKGFREASVNGHLDMLELLEYQGYCGYSEVGLLLKTAEAGQMNAVRRIIGDLSTENNTVGRQEDIGFALRLDRSSGRVKVSPRGLEAGFAIHAAAANGHLSVAKYLYDRVDIKIDFEDDSLENEIPVGWMKALERKFGAEDNLASVSRDTMVLAAERGFLDVVQWLWTEFGNDSAMNFLSVNKSDYLKYDCALDAAAANGHLEILQYLHQIRDDRAGHETRNLKRRRLLQYPVLFARPGAISEPSPGYGASSSRTAVGTTAAMDLAAAHGHVEIVRWLHHNRPEGCTTNAMDLAARNGHLDVVKWLHHHRTEGCTTNAMDGAATNGYMGVVTWLHAHRTEGCTTAAMDGTSSSGHLRIVQWFHHNRSEGCTTTAMDSAAAAGALDVVKWLHHNRGEGCTTSAMDGAAGNGHLRIIRWLHQNRDEGFSATGMDQAVINAKFECLALLHKIKRGAFSVAALHIAEQLRPDLRGWLVEHYPIFRQYLHQYR